METEDIKKRCMNCRFSNRVKGKSAPNRLIHICARFVDIDPWSVINKISRYGLRASQAACSDYEYEAEKKPKYTTEEFIKKYFGEERRNLLPEGLEAALKDLTIKEAVQYRNLLNKGALTPLLGFRSETTAATCAAVAQAQNLINEIIDNKASEQEP